MDKKIILAVLLVAIIVFVIISISNNNTQNNLQPSGDTEQTSSVKEETKQQDIKKELATHNVPERFMEIIENIISNGYASVDDIKTSDELKESYSLEEIGEYEGILIKNEDQDNYNEIALIVPSDNSLNDTLLLKMISRYESIKANNPTATYLRLPENVSIKQQGGMSIFILSTNNESIYNLINEVSF